MRLTNKFLSKFSAVLSLIIFMVLSQITVAQNQADTKKSFLITENKTEYKLVGWEKETVYNPFTYTWYEWTEPKWKKTKKKVVHAVKLEDFDRPPVFDGYCLSKESNAAQVECTNEEMQEFVSNQYFDYPDEAQSNSQEGLEYVSFVLNEKGKFEGDLKVMSKDKPCKGCSDAAADIVAAMEGKWYPAIKDGKPVKTHLTIPIRFEIINK